MNHQWKEHQVIYLAPECDACHGKVNLYEGRHWCQDPQEPCDECGKAWVKFTLAPDAEQTKNIEIVKR